MNRSLKLAISMAVIVLSVLPLVAAQSASQPMTMPAIQMSTGGQSQGQTDKMDKMAESMTAMAQTCQTMMQHEHETLRYVVIGGSVIGVLVLIALILFIILEIQWIRFFGVRINTEQRKLTLKGEP